MQHPQSVSGRLSRELRFAGCNRAGFPSSLVKPAPPSGSGFGPAQNQERCNIQLSESRLSATGFTLFRCKSAIQCRHPYARKAQPRFATSD
ncbi:hypothetical protein PC119_g9143 [Phytophthora cactorum]|nr:hypothetical protein PC119_g9143 [Phytophthora cactorum]